MAKDKELSVEVEKKLKESAQVGSDLILPSSQEGTIKALYETKAYRYKKAVEALRSRIKTIRKKKR